MKPYVIGIDEAGRGPLAGPIVAAAVLFRGLKKEQHVLANVRDSKTLTNKQRENLFIPIIKNMAWSVAVLDNEFIDKYGIQSSNVLVFHEVLEDLKNMIDKPVKVYADYVGGAEHCMQHINFYKHGESRHKEIAAASIIAKVFRDHLMMDYDHSFPHYDFWLHKGYGTRRHFDSLTKFGPCPIHRRSFLKNVNI
jgi:ribonuclease HII